MEPVEAEKAVEPVEAAASAHGKESGFETVEDQPNVAVAREDLSKVLPSLRLYSSKAPDLSGLVGNFVELVPEQEPAFCFADGRSF